MRVKRWILKGISLIFSIFLSFKYALTRVFLLLLGRLPLKITETLRRSIFLVCQKRQVTKSVKNEQSDGSIQEREIQLTQCLQSVIDSALSLCLTASLVNYNQSLVKFTLVISHQVHHSFLSLISNHIPDYTSEIEQQYSYFLIWVFIVLGFLGFSFQMAFIMDLINIFTLPTKLIYGVLRIVYRNCIQGIGRACEFMNTNEKKWITCPYSEKLINPNFRTSTFGILIILIHITVFTSFYYIWLAFVILLLNLLQILLANSYVLWIRLQKLICSFKQNHVTLQQTAPNDSYQTFFQPETALKIFQGIDMFKQKQNETSHYNNYHYNFNFSLLFNSFLKIEKNHQS